MDAQNLKILLCDDSLLVRKKMKNGLVERGFSQVFEASDGEEAVELSRSLQPDLVLMDIVMPRKDGIEALKEIKEMNKDTHIIMVSSVGTQGNLIKALKAGADNFMQKPVSLDALTELIQTLSQERGES